MSCINIPLITLFVCIFATAEVIHGEQAATLYRQQSELFQDLLSNEASNALEPLPEAKAQGAIDSIVPEGSSALPTQSTELVQVPLRAVKGKPHGKRKLQAWQQPLVVTDDPAQQLKLLVASLGMMKGKSKGKALERAIQLADEIQNAARTTVEKAGVVKKEVIAYDEANGEPAKDADEDEIKAGCKADGKTKGKKCGKQKGRADDLINKGKDDIQQGQDEYVDGKMKGKQKGKDLIRQGDDDIDKGVDDLRKLKGKPKGKNKGKAEDEAGKVLVGDGVVECEKAQEGMAKGKRKGREKGRAEAKLCRKEIKKGEKDEVDGDYEEDKYDEKGKLPGKPKHTIKSAKLAASSAQRATEHATGMQSAIEKAVEEGDLPESTIGKAEEVVAASEQSKAATVQAQRLSHEVAEAHGREAKAEAIEAVVEAAANAKAAARTTADQAGELKESAQEGYGDGEHGDEDGDEDGDE